MLQKKIILGKNDIQFINTEILNKGKFVSLIKNFKQKYLAVITKKRKKMGTLPYSLNGKPQRITVKTAEIIRIPHIIFE